MWQPLGIMEASQAYLGATWVVLGGLPAARSARLFTLKVP